MARLWNDLPPEIVENVLARLPVHVLCRVRLVCKTWNDLITRPRFASLCAQSPQASYVLIMPRVLHLCRSTQSTSRNWEILDIAEKRFYSVSDSFIAHYLRRTNEDFEHFIPCTKYTLAVDGGLLYAMYSKYKTQQHIVCNPVTKDIHQIMEPKFDLSYDRDIVVMSVDNATQSYRIVVMHSCERSQFPFRGKVYLYDSKTLHWRMLCKLPGDKYLAHSSIFLKGVLFTLFLDLSSTPWRPKLYVCDFESGDWIYIDVGLPRLSHPQDKSQLVVSSDRLFLVEYTGLPRGTSSNMIIWANFPGCLDRRRKNNQLINATIWEIVLDEREVKKVAKMPRFAKDKHRSPALMGNPVAALGCGDSIIISSLVAGCCVGFDLVKNRWHDPSTDVEHMYGTCKRDVDREGMYAGLVHLDLRKRGDDLPTIATARSPLH